MKEYYARRAGEYEATSWDEFDPSEREVVERFVASLPPGHVLDIGCGTGYLTRLLRGRIVALDQSAEMLGLARARVPSAEFVRADVPPLPFPDGAFDLAFSSNVYSHIGAAAARAAFIAEALRVARTLVVLEQAWPWAGAGVVGAAPAARRVGAPHFQALLHRRRAGARA